MYRVTVDFRGVENNDGTGKVFRVGDAYPDPTTGFKPTKRRINYLLSNNTSFGRPVIEEAQPEESQPAKR